ncbi:MAG: GrpB family protein, partial [Gammaproteobacteria bacterium]
MPRTIKVVGHAPAWTAAFEQEAAALAGVFGSHLLRIHHIGSTSVPGVCAKPI